MYLESYSGAPNTEYNLFLWLSVSWLASRVSLFPVKPFPGKRESRQSISREIPGNREFLIIHIINTAINIWVQCIHVLMISKLGKSILIPSLNLTPKVQDEKTIAKMPEY